MDVSASVHHLSPPSEALCHSFGVKQPLIFRPMARVALPDQQRILYRLWFFRNTCFRHHKYRRPHIYIVLASTLNGSGSHGMHPNDDDDNDDDDTDCLGVTRYSVAQTHSNWYENNGTEAAAENIQRRDPPCRGVDLAFRPIHKHNVGIIRCTCAHCHVNARLCII
jgi:hypothetical protein